MGVNIIRDIVCDIADLEEVDPHALDPPLGAVVNTDILEAVAAACDHGETMVAAPLEFQYHGYIVTIDPDGAVDVSDPAKAPIDHRTTGSRQPVDTSTDESTTHESVMKEATDIIAARDRPFTTRLDGLLSLIRDTLDMDAATLSYVADGSYVFEAVDVTETVDIQAGAIDPLAETVCKRVVETEQVLALRDVEAEAPELADATHTVASYLGVPVFVDGDVYGTFCCYDEEPRAEAFSEWELAFVEFLSNWVSSELERRHREWALQRGRPDSKRTAS